MNLALERLLAALGCLLMVGGFVGLMVLCRDPAIHADELAAGIACGTGMATLCWLLVRRAW